MCFPPLMKKRKEKGKLRCSQLFNFAVYGYFEHAPNHSKNAYAEESPTEFSGIYSPVNALHIVTTQQFCNNPGVTSIMSNTDVPP